MKTFENFKEYIVAKATELNACNDELSKAKNSTDFKELFQVIKDNINWSISNKLINTDILLNYVDDVDLVDNGFYVKKQFTEFTESNTCFFTTKVEILKANILNLSDTSSVGEMYDTSSVGEMSDTSSVGRMYDTSSVGRMSGTSSVGRMYDTSSVGEMSGTSSVGRMYDTSSVGEMYGTSSVGRMSGTSSVGRMYDTSSVGEMSDTSSVGRMYDTSSVGEMSDTSSVGEMSDTSSVGRMYGTSLYKKHTPFGKTKLYIKKDAFEIIEIE